MDGVPYVLTDIRFVEARNLRLLEELQRVRAEDIAGNENERRSATRVAKFHLPVEAWTIKLRHPDIGDDEVIAPLIEALQRRRGVRGGLNLVSIDREDVCQEIRLSRVVVHD